MDFRSGIFFNIMENIINSWLEGPRDYAEGRAIFEKYSNKRNLINLFRRKYKPEVLLYNMKKLCKNPVKQKTEDRPLDVKPLPGGRKKIETDRVNYDGLPPRLQRLYDQNKELYKHYRAYHEKLKLVQTDAEREKLRKIVAEYDDVIAGNWKQIDAWDGSSEVAEEKDREKEIANARKFLSVNVKYLDLREGLKQQLLLFDIKEKAELLNSFNVMVPKATVEALKKFGINI